MKSTVSFLGKFRGRGGVAIFTSSIGVKMMSTLVAIVIARLLTPELYGQVSYAIIVVSLLVPIAGGGLDMALLRYGALCPDLEKRASLARYTYVMGTGVSLALVAVLVVAAPLICKSQPASVEYLYVISFLLVGTFLYNSIGAQLRTDKDNQKFARLNISRSVILFVLILLLVPAFNAYGYAFALIGSPLVAAIIFRKNITRLRGRTLDALPFPATELWKYALFVGAGSMLSQLQLQMDIIIVGNLIPDPGALALYRVASILPMSLFLLPQVFFLSEYVHITENHNSRAFIVDYLKQYLALSVAISAGLILFTQLFGDILMTLLFGEQYSGAGPIFKILVIGFCGAMVLRQPGALLLNTSGRAVLTVLNVIVTLLIQLIIMMQVVPIYGLLGAATVMAGMLWFSGATCMLLYFIFVFPKLQR